MPAPDFREEADRIVRAQLEACFVSPRPGADRFDIREAIAAALRAAHRVPEGYVRAGDEDFTLRQQSVNPLSRFRHITCEAAAKEKA
jgi:hypothetical protein